MAAIWQAGRDGYRLRQPELHGRLLLRGPSPGLRDVAGPFGGPERWPGPILGVANVQAAGRPLWKVHGSPAPADRRLRGNLVDLQLAATRRCPVRLHLYWRAAASPQLDLEVLATTAPPLEHLEVLTATRIPRAEVFVPIAGTVTRWLNAAELLAHAPWLVVPRDRDAAGLSLDGRFPHFGDFGILPAFAYPLVLVRPANQQSSYFEMSHPEDCARVIVGRRGRATQVCFGLFGLDLEKGVIARGRMRASFIPRANDAETAIALFSQFLREAPHLSV